MTRTDVTARQVDDMPMVREGDRLAALAHRRRYTSSMAALERSSSKELVEVIGDEGGAVLGDERGAAGDPEREV